MSAASRVGEACSSSSIGRALRFSATHNKVSYGDNLPATVFARTAFDSSPIPVTVACAAEVMPRVEAAILCPRRELRPDDRDVLLETLEAWRDNDGSANGAGAKLFCHPNTVR